MLRPILLVSMFALTAPAWAQETTDAPPVTEGVAAPEAADQTAPDLPPGEVPTGMDHSKMEHSQDKASTTTTTATEAAEEATETMTTATEGASVGANAEASTEADVAATTDAATTDAATTATTTTATTTTTADVGAAMPAAPTATFTGMGGPADIESEWATFDKGGDGTLTPLEFAVWMADSAGRPATEASLKSDAVELLNEAADELALVDANNDWHVSREELTAASPQ